MYNYFTAPTIGLQMTQKHSQELIFLCPRMKQLFNLSTKTSACKNLLNLDSCLSNNVCRNCVDKNSNLLDLLQKVDSVRERFNVRDGPLEK